jgi:hypothetical protein
MKVIRPLFWVVEGIDKVVETPCAALSFPQEQLLTFQCREEVFDIFMAGPNKYAGIYVDMFKEKARFYSLNAGLFYVPY